jgi:type VI secretion system secreted protein VgrG
VPRKDYGPCWQEALNYPLPKLPRSELATRDLKFKLRLAATPGPNGHALTATPWKIAYGRVPDGLMFVDDTRLVAQGMSDAKGNIALTADQEAKLAEIYCMHPDHTWLVYPGHTVRVNIATESAEWSEKDKLLHALSAADFSPDLHNTIFGDGALPQSRYAKEVFETAATKVIFQKIKG